jgi:hypothetical protein
MGRFVITIPPISIARELWRFGEPALSEQAAVLTTSQAADIGARAGILHQSGEALRMWPGGPSGVTPAVMLAAVEYLEGTARPCGRSRRLPEKQLPEKPPGHGRCGLGGQRTCLTRGGLPTARPDFRITDNFVRDL